MLSRAGFECICPREGAIVDLRALNGRCSKWLTAGAGDASSLDRSECVDWLIEDGEADSSLKCLTNAIKRTLAWIQAHALSNDFIGVLGHLWEDIEQGLLVAGEVKEQWVGFGGSDEWVSSEKNVQQADANGPNVSLIGSVSSAGRVVLFRGHVSVTADIGLPCPFIRSGQTEIAKLHFTSFCEEDVLRLDITMIHALAVNVGNGIDKLKHERPDLFSLGRSAVVSDCLVQVASRTEFENDVDVCFGFEGMDEVDDIRVGTQAGVAFQFFRTFVDGECRVNVGGFLGQALDGHEFVGLQIPGHENHTERAMVEGRDGLKASIKDNSIVESILKAFHCDGF